MSDRPSGLGPRHEARHFGAFVADERGAELVEWAVLTVLVVAATIAVLTAIPVQLGKAFESVLKRFMPTLSRI